MKKYFKNFLALGFGLFVSLLLLEVFLRFYNPFPSRIMGDKIILPANKKYEFENNYVRGLDPYIIHTKNALGFRGENLPANFGKKITIIAVGGSATECFYLSDGDDWPNIIKTNLQKKMPHVWLNNAGLDGHSTFGHIVLLQDYLVKIKPDYLLFLVGANDIERNDLTDFDNSNMRNRRNSIKKYLVENSEIVNIIYNFRKVKEAKNKQVLHFNLDLENAGTLVFSEEEIQIRLQKQKPYLQTYKKRLQTIIDICETEKIKPIFITQPCLLGFGKDSLTGTDLANAKIGEKNGALYWRILTLYNLETISFCNKKNIPVIDLAGKMPKNSGYFYDNLHFTKAGSRKVAEIVSQEIIPYIK